MQLILNWHSLAWHFRAAKKLLTPVLGAEWPRPSWCGGSACSPLLLAPRTAWEVLRWCWCGRRQLPLPHKCLGSRRGSRRHSPAGGTPASCWLACVTCCLEPIGAFFTHCWSFIIDKIVNLFLIVYLFVCSGNNLRIQDCGHHLINNFDPHVNDVFSPYLVYTTTTHPPTPHTLFRWCVVYDPKFYTKQVS